MKFYIKNDSLGGEIEITEPGMIKVQISGDKKVEAELKDVLDKGIPYYKEFKNPDMPGRMKLYRPVKTKEDISEILKQFKLWSKWSDEDTEMYEDPLNIIDPSNSHTLPIVDNGSLIDFKDAKFKKVIQETGILREFQDRYEFCIMRDYEKILEDFSCDSIQLDDIFIQIVKSDNQYYIVSFEFSKRLFSIDDIISWLDKCSVILVTDKKFRYVENAAKIVQGVKFRGMPIVVYEKGNNKIVLQPDSYVEVTKNYQPNIQTIDTTVSKEVCSRDQHNGIVFNSKVITDVPRIDFDLSKDLVISNGNIMVANYIGDYGGNVAFYGDYDYLPIAWLHNATTVSIDIYEKDGSKICIVESQCNIELDKL